MWSFVNQGGGKGVWQKTQFLLVFFGNPFQKFPNDTLYLTAPQWPRAPRVQVSKKMMETFLSLAHNGQMGNPRNGDTLAVFHCHQTDPIMQHIVRRKKASFVNSTHPL